MIRDSISHWVSSLKNELIEMDISSRNAEIEAWKKFRRHDEFFHFDDRIFNDWEKQAWLDWKEIRLNFNVKEHKSILSNLSQWFGITPKTQNKIPKLKITKSKPGKSIAVQVIFTKLNGEIKSDVQMFP